MVTALLVVLAAAPAAGQASSAGAFADDPLLRALAAEALAQRPELAEAAARIEAEAERVPQASAWPEPMLSLGLQGESFSGLHLGVMPDDKVSIMASQTVPFWGKRELRAQAARSGISLGEAQRARTRLTIQAEVERAYLALLLAREQLGLLSRLDRLWLQSEGLAKVRYEAGEGPQSDLLRAQLERTRLRQRRLALEADERRRVVVLDRLCGRPLDSPIETTRSLAELSDPDPIVPSDALTEATRASPELGRASLEAERADRLASVARRDLYPDFTVNIALMPRGGAFSTMWQAGVAFNLPVWTATRQARAVAEQEALRRAALRSGETVRHLLDQRVAERALLLSSLVATNRLYREGLLVQSEATVTSTLAQYQVGQVTFTSVLEALAGLVGDVSGFLESIVAAQRVAIAQRELSLEEPGAGAGAGLGGGPMPGAGAMGAGGGGSSTMGGGRGGPSGVPSSPGM